MFGIIGDLTKAVVGAVAARRKPAVTPIATAPRDGTTFIGYLNGMVWTTYAGRYDKDGRVSRATKRKSNEDDKTLLCMELKGYDHAHEENDEAT